MNLIFYSASKYCASPVQVIEEISMLLWESLLRSLKLCISLSQRIQFLSNNYITKVYVIMIFDFVIALVQ